MNDDMRHLSRGWWIGSVLLYLTSVLCAGLGVLLLMYRNDLVHDLAWVLIALGATGVALQIALDVEHRRAARRALVRLLAEDEAQEPTA